MDTKLKKTKNRIKNADIPKLDALLHAIYDKVKGPTPPEDKWRYKTLLPNDFPSRDAPLKIVDARVAVWASKRTGLPVTEANLGRRRDVVFGHKCADGNYSAPRAAVAPVTAPVTAPATAPETENEHKATRKYMSKIAVDIFEHATVVAKSDTARHEAIMELLKSAIDSAHRVENEFIEYKQSRHKADAAMHTKMDTLRNQILQLHLGGDTRGQNKIIGSAGNSG